ncbi:endonuclease V isoform X3 [Leptonychotes weddellii]|uniref:Endonuclease V isoform X3 n=1 Tax=Leptonychotes weddellii TaxID=9713 RepID=A0A7F8Q563_LEPWE|nr:endonuclease V isoform X3 [Leptonychotes weddellii]
MAREAVAWPPEETLSLWKREQARLKALVVDRDTEAWQRDAAFSGLQRVGGVDVSFVKGDSVSACASLVVLSYPELEVVYEDCCMVSLTAPYVSGFLAFREVPFLVDAVRRLQEKEPRLVPQVLLVDGNGVLHHRGGRRHLPPQPDNCEIGAEGCVPGQAGSPSPVFPVLSPPTGLCLPGKIRRVLVCSLSTPSLDYLAHCPTSPASLSAPAGFGVACHLGVLTDLPCVGVAKKLLQVDGLENDAQHKEKERKRKWFRPTGSTCVSSGQVGWAGVHQAFIPAWPLHPSALGPRWAAAPSPGPGFLIRRTRKRKLSSRGLIRVGQCWGWPPGRQVRSWDRYDFCGLEEIHFL